MSPKAVVAREAALLDVDDAVTYYQEQAGTDAALGFVDALQSAFRHLSRHPGTGSPRLGHELDLPGLRSWPLTRYPYLVFYVEQDDALDVWRVLHSARDIPAWLLP